MTDTECRLLASIRSQAPSKATDLGHRCGVDHETLYGDLVRLESMGLIRITVDNNNPNKRQALWETA